MSESLRQPQSRKKSSFGQYHIAPASLAPPSQICIGLDCSRGSLFNSANSSFPTLIWEARFAFSATLKPVSESTLPWVWQRYLSRNSWKLEAQALAFGCRSSTFLSPAPGSLSSDFATAACSSCFAVGWLIPTGLPSLFHRRRSNLLQVASPQMLILLREWGLKLKLELELKPERSPSSCKKPGCLKLQNLWESWKTSAPSVCSPFCTCCNRTYLSRPSYRAKIFGPRTSSVSSFWQFGPNSPTGRAASKTGRI